MEQHDYVNRSALLEPKTGVLFTDFIKKTIARKSRHMGESYGKNYQTLIYHLKKFSRIYNATIYTESVSCEFGYDFIEYLENENLRCAYIKYILDLIRAMIRKAAISGYAVDPSHDEIDIRTEEQFSIYLSENDIARIYYFKGLSKANERIRDLFVIGCTSSLRYSDYSTLDQSNFQNGFIRKITKKTNTEVVIPVHGFIGEIFNKYGGELRFGLSIQYFNRAVKKICKQIGFTDEISFSYTKGGKLIKETKPEWQLISSHTARRSAVTNLYLTGRMKVREIMEISGHKDEKSFYRYVKVTKNEIATKLNSDIFFRI